VWRPGDAIVRREIWRGRPWLGTTVRVVEDAPELLAVYLPEGAPFAFPDGDWPGGRHPWHGRGRWEGHGVLMLQRPDEAVAVFVFWHGPERAFHGWDLNFQAPFRRTPVGIDTSDHELDIWIETGGRWQWKDAELLEERVREGRFTPAEADAIRAEGHRVATALDRGERWWNESWARWAPDPAWGPAELPAGWDVA